MAGGEHTAIRTTGLSAGEPCGTRAELADPTAEMAEGTET